MLLTAAVTLSLFSHLPGLPHPAHAPPRAHGARKTAFARARPRKYKLGPWLISVKPDPFAGTTACSLHTRQVGFQRDTLIFRVAPSGDTTHAVFRVDAGPPKPVSVAFEADEARGFFPQRGWIVDPQGGQVALPPATVAGAKAVWFQLAPKDRPRRFDVARFAEAEAAAEGLGCAF